MNFQEKIIALLNEKTFHNFKIRNNDVKILINPTASEMKSLNTNAPAELNDHREYRALLLKSGDILVWDGYDSMHSDVMNELDNKNEVELRLVIDPNVINLTDPSGRKLIDSDFKTQKEKLESLSNYKRIAGTRKILTAGKS